MIKCLHFIVQKRKYVCMYDISKQEMATKMMDRRDGWGEKPQTTDLKWLDMDSKKKILFFGNFIISVNVY